MRKLKFTHRVLRRIFRASCIYNSPTFRIHNLNVYWPELCYDSSNQNRVGIKGRQERTMSEDLPARLTVDQPQRSVLVVDDELRIIELMRHALERTFNCQVVTATTVKDALKHLAVQPFDLLITDYKMPEMDGLIFARLARQITPDIEVVILTGYTDAHLLQAAEELSIRYILSKPVRLAEVRKAVAEIFQPSVRTT
ncbi:MAG: response regulator [Chloroflexi bacterium]|nr:MAG: response regulator [Chloroflexota bacterium]